jgi:hypothetical protein
VTPADRLQWRFDTSGTLRGIYVIRFFLFSGGCAILGALVERAATGSDRSVAGLLIGFALGMVLFRGQLRALGWPALVLSQERLYLIVKGKAVAVIPWSSIGEVERQHGLVCLRLVEAVEGGSTQALRLVPRQHGVGLESLEKTLRTLAGDPALRSRLPSDEQLRRVSAIPPPG